MRRILRAGGRAAIAVSLLLGACSEPPAPASSPVSSDLPSSAHTPRVSIEIQPEYGDVHYTVVQGDCRITWVVRKPEPGVMLHRPECTAPLAAQLPLIEQLLLAVRKRPEPPRSLFWGTLHDPKSEAERLLSRRLAQAAHESAGWDAVKGRPRQGNDNDFVRREANAAMIYPELRELFARHGLRIEATGIEKVGVLPARELPYYAELQAAGVKPDERLPFDCMLWFRISPL